VIFLDLTIFYGSLSNKGGSINLLPLQLIVNICLHLNVDVHSISFLFFRIHTQWVAITSVNDNKCILIMRSRLFGQKKNEIK